MSTPKRFPQDFAELAEALADGDYLPVVDVSDTTQSAAGSLKKTTLQRVKDYAGGGGSGGGSSIADTAGTTSVETERTPGDATVRMRAGGVDVAALSATKQKIQSAVQAGRQSLFFTGTDVYPGYPGFVLAVAPEGEDPTTSPSNVALMGYAGAGGPSNTAEGGGTALAVSTVNAIGGERPEAVIQGDAQIDTIAGTAYTSATLSARFGSGEYDSAGVRASAKDDGTRELVFRANGSAETQFNDPAAVDLPADYASIMAALVDLEARRLKPWAAVFEAGSNVASFALLNATQRVEGDYVTLEGSLSITPLASGPTMVAAPLPIADDAAGAAGVACCFSLTIGASSTGVAVLMGSPNLGVAIDALDASMHIASFSITYKKGA